MDGLTAEIKDIALATLPEDVQPHVHLRPAGSSGFELLCNFTNDKGEKDTVGMLIAMSAFHKTESFHEEWRNRFNNLLDMKAVKLGETDDKA